MKFGGTSVRDAERLANAAAIVDGRRESGAVVVVSAAAGVTRRLLELGRCAAAEARDRVERELAGLQAQHDAALRGLDLDRPIAEAAACRLARSLANLRRELDAIERRGEVSARDLDAVMSTGERLSSALMTAALQRRGVAVERVDARRVVVTDDTFRAAKPDRAAIDRRARRLIEPLLARGAVVVTEGFIGATADRVTTTMGFEASDLSAALLGAALGAAQVQIWTDVPGMLTTGHPAVDRPRKVDRLSYDEAAELALFGAKVLHPQTVAPARERGIPVRILDAADPDGEGTWIGDPSSSPAGSPASGGAGAAAGGVVKAIAVIEDGGDESFTALHDTLRLEHAAGLDGRAIVCPVGTGIGSARSVIELVRGALDGIDASFPLARRADAIPVAVARDRTADAVRRLHDALIPAAEPAGD